MKCTPAKPPQAARAAHISQEVRSSSGDGTSAGSHHGDARGEARSSSQSRDGSSAAAIPLEFAPYLAGERTSIDQRPAAFTGMTLSTTREQLLAAVVDALARASAERLPLLKQVTKLSRQVTVTGGVADGLSKILHRDWGGGWHFHMRDELTSAGLAQLGAMATS